jgi:hypothetical protein
MSRWFRAGATAVAQTTPAASDTADSGGRKIRYLTDGVHLYRFLGPLATRAGGMIGIENCRSLDIMLVPADDLHQGHLRAVGSASGD